MRYCSECGSGVVKKKLAGDSVPRYHCDSCGRTHYQNPVILVSCYALRGKKALWIKRRTEPYAGLWAIPSGYMEQDESPQQAAAREVYEETGARVDIDRMELHTVGTIVDINQVYLVFRAPLTGAGFGPSEEAEEVRLLSASEVPYDEFAYPEVTSNVEEFYRELDAGRFNVHLGVLRNGQNTVRAVRPDYP